MPLADALRHRAASLAAVRIVPLALALTLAACTTASTPNSSVTTPPTTPSAAASPAPSPAASAMPTAAPTSAPVTLCAVKALSAAIVAGSVNHASGGLLGFDVTIKNVGSVACTLRQLDRVKMVDKNGVALITAPAPGASALLFLNVGAVLRTTIQARNFCGGVPVEPVTVEFVEPSGAIVRATPLATNPGSIVPSCFQGGVAASISMSGWGP